MPPIILSGICRTRKIAPTRAAFIIKAFCIAWPLEERCQSLAANPAHPGAESRWIPAQSWQKHGVRVSLTRPIGLEVKPFRSAGLALVLLAAPALLAGEARAQTYPSRPVRLIVPFPPGGSTDILSRALGQKLSEGLAQPVLIDNRPGAGGSIGSEAAAKAAPDGYTLLMGQLGPLAVSPAIYKNLPYDPVKSFAPVSLMAMVPSVLVVNPQVPAASAAELIAHARANPGKLTYGSAGSGSTSHLTTEYFKLATGTDVLHVPYKGVGPMLTDLISGQLSMGINGAPAVMPHVNSGRLRALAVTSLTRVPSLPSIPTLDEAGGSALKGFEANGWYGIVAPAGTSREIVARLNAEIRRAIDTPELRARLDAEGAIPAADSPEAFAAFIASEIARWGAVLKRAGIEAQ